MIALILAALMAQPWMLTHHDGWKNPQNPPQCYSEDDHDNWQWQGTLPGGASFSFDVPFCYYFDGTTRWTGGNNDLIVSVATKGQLSLWDQCVAACRIDGAGGDGLPHDAQFLVRRNGTPLYVGCELKHVSPTGIGSDPLGGTYRVTLSNPTARGVSALLTIDHHSLWNAAQQQGACPASDWNQ